MSKIPLETVGRNDDQTIMTDLLCNFKIKKTHTHNKQIKQKKMFYYIQPAKHAKLGKLVTLK